MEGLFVKKYRVWLHTGYAGHLIEDEIEVDDNETLDEIEEQCRDVAFQTIDWGYEEINEEV